jgi:hypothetical protein
MVIAEYGFLVDEAVEGVIDIGFDGASGLVRSVDLTLQP